MTGSKRNAEIRYARQVNTEEPTLALDPWPSSSSGGGLIIAELGPAVSRSPVLSPLLEGGLKSPEPVSVFFCVRVLRVLRAVISGNTSLRVERTQPTIGSNKRTEQTDANSACFGHVIKDQLPTCGEAAPRLLSSSATSMDWKAFKFERVLNQGS